MIRPEYGDDQYSDRSELRSVVWEIAQGRCEHPLSLPAFDKEPPFHAPCGRRADELAHITPRGMGHQGDRDTINNAIAACWLHARSTDDLGSPEWGHVPFPHDRKALKDWILMHRRSHGWAL